MKIKDKIKPGFLILLVLIFLLGSFVIYQPGIKIIFRNESKEDFKELKVNIRGQEFEFFNLKSGGATKPIWVPGSYSYCFAKATTLKDTVICQPIDYVGEKLYTSGKLVMNLVILPEEGGERYLIIR